MDLRKVSSVDYVEQEHGPVYNFLYSFKTHFLTLMSVNLLFSIFNIPMFFVAFAFTIFILPILNDTFVPANFVEFMAEAGLVGNETINDIGAEASYQLYYLIVVFCVMFLVGSGLFCVGPFQAGFSKIYRNLYRQEGVFIIADFKDGVKENWKQALASMIISLVVSAVSLFAIGFYLNSGTTLTTVFGTFFVLFFFVFIIVQNMVNTMIVSVDMPLHKMYRNAFLFFLIKFGPCVGLLGIIVLMLLVIPFALILTTTYAAYGFLVFYYLTFVFFFIQYMLAFFTGELISTYIGKAPSASDEEFDDLDDDDEDNNELPGPDGEDEEESDDSVDEE